MMALIYTPSLLLVLATFASTAESFLHSTSTYTSRHTAPSLPRFHPPNKANLPSSLQNRPAATTSTRLFVDLWDRMEIEEDDDPQWYLLNCVAGLEMELLQQCRVACADLPDVVKFVVPTVMKTRSHGAKRMVQDVKVKYLGYVFAKLRLTRETYTAIQQLDLCRSWMGTINMKGYKKLPPAPLPLTEEDIENFDLENTKWMQTEPEIVSTAVVATTTKDRTIILDTEEYELEENRILTEIEEEVQTTYKGLKVEDMVKVTSTGKFHNEDGIVRRLKEEKVLIRFFTYGTVFDEWLDPTEVRKLTDEEILKGLGGPSAPITQQDIDGPRQNDRDSDDRNDRFDRRNEVGAFGGGRDRRQDRNERRFRNDGDNDGDGKGRDNWNWYQQNERRSRDGGYSDGEEHIRGSADQGKSRDNFWAESDVDSQWGRGGDQRRDSRRDQQRQPRSDNRGGQQKGDWSSFISKSSAPQQTRNQRGPPTKEETDDFFASLMSDLSNDLDGDDKFNDKSSGGGGNSDDDFFASLMSEINDDDRPSAESRSRSKASSKDKSDDDDDFFASLEREMRGSTSDSRSSPNKRETRQKTEFNAEEQLDNIFAELSMETQGTAPRAPSGFENDDDDFFASLEAELSSELDEKKQIKPTKQEAIHSKDPDEDDFFASLEAELAEDLDQGVIQKSNADTASTDDDFFASLEAELSTGEGPKATDAPVKETKDPARKPKAVPTPVAEDIEVLKPGPKDIDVGALQKRTVPELKDMLRERGLKVSGKKAELIERLSL